MYKTKKEGNIDRELFRRTFHADETSEVRLYGLGGLDQFVISGSGGSRIRIRAIGGNGEDRYADDSDAGRVWFYDTEEGSFWQPGRGTHVVKAEDPTENEYDMLRFEVDQLGFVPYIERNADDGALIGGGIAWIKRGFRKDPYAARHRLRANYAFRTGAYNVIYDHVIADVVGPWDLWSEASLLTPHEFDNYFGLGNNTPNTDVRRQLYASNLARLTLTPELVHQIVPFVSARFGPHFHYWDVERPSGWSAPDVEGSGLTESQFTDTYFVGGHGALTIDGRDSLAATRHGFYWDNAVEMNVGVRNADERFARLSTDMRYYYTFTRFPSLTLAFRGGAATNLGGFRFYQANTLGNRYNLRGFVRTRFSGRSSVFTNFDARLRLGDLNAYVTRGEFGIYGFFDNGRVWSDEEGAEWHDLVDLVEWHQGYGGGIWFAPFYKLVLTTGLEFSSENTLFDVSIGFFF